jgi:hypothetical protein
VTRNPKKRMLPLVRDGTRPPVWTFENSYLLGTRVNRALGQQDKSTEALPRARAWPILFRYRYELLHVLVIH